MSEVDELVAILNEMLADQRNDMIKVGVPADLADRIARSAADRALRRWAEGPT